MRASIITLATLMAAAGFASNAAALTLSANPHAQVASAGDLIDIAVNYDDEGEGTLGGAFSIEYDGAALEPVDYQYSLIGNPGWQYRPGKDTGRLNDFTAGSFSGLANGDLVSITFRVLRDGQHTITLLPSPLGSLWPSGADFGTFFTPDYIAGVISTDTAPIPVISVAREFVGDTIFLGNTTRIGVPVINTGNAPLQINSASLATNPGDNYTIIDDKCSGQTLAPGNQCEIGVRYGADELPFGGTQRARLEIQSNDSFKPQAFVALRGVVASPKLRLSSVDFFDARIDPPYRVYQATVFNAGDWPAAINSITTGPTIPSNWFQLVGDECSGTTLGVGERCTIKLRLVAEEARAGFTYLNLRHDNGSFRPSFTLWGYTPTPLYEVATDGPLVFDIPVGATTTRRVTITNKGPGNLTLGGREANSNEKFTIMQDTCSDTSIEPGLSCFVDLGIELTDVGIETHFVYFETNSLLVSRFLNSKFRVTARRP